jgi:hypothetical protein
MTVYNRYAAFWALSKREYILIPMAELTLTEHRVVTYGASAIQIGFFWETGSQVEWGASSSFLRDLAAMKILFSGTRTVCMVGILLFVVSVLVTRIFIQWQEIHYSQLVDSSSRAGACFHRIERLLQRKPAARIIAP